MESNQEADHSEGEPHRAGSASRLLHIAGALLSVHMEIAQREMAQEQARITRGAAMMVLSWMCLCAVVWLLHAVAVISLHDLLRLRWLWSVVMTMSADLMLFAVLRWLGTRQLKAPVLPTTRAMVRKTISSLRN